MPNNTEVILRVVSGLALLIGTILFGYFHRSLWSIVLMGIVFTAGYVAGKWPLWKAMTFEHGMIYSIVKLPPVLLVQVILVSVLYIIGYGLGALLGTATGTVSLSGQDFIVAGCLFGFSLGPLLFVPKQKS